MTRRQADDGVVSVSRAVRSHTVPIQAITNVPLVEAGTTVAPDVIAAAASSTSAVVAARASITRCAGSTISNRTGCPVTFVSVTERDGNPPSAAAGVSVSRGVAAGERDGVTECAGLGDAPRGPGPASCPMPGARTTVTATVAISAAVPATPSLNGVATG